MCKYLSRATYFRTTRTISLLELLPLGAENERANLRSVKRKSFGSGGIRTHASEETGALNQRLRPLGHATFIILRTTIYLYIIHSKAVSKLSNYIQSMRLGVFAKNSAFTMFVKLNEISKSTYHTYLYIVLISL